MLFQVIDYFPSNTFGDAIVKIVNLLSIVTMFFFEIRKEV